jgi:2-haloacid dehalogenase
MIRRPAVVAFDIIETTFSLQSLGPRLAAVGLPDDVVLLWYARILRDGFALAVTDVFATFRELAAETLESMAAERGIALDAAARDGVLDGFAELDPFPDSAAAFRLLVEAGVRVVALSNGAAASTQALLARAGMTALVERVISVMEVSRFKPRRELYLHAAAVVGVAPAEMMLVATHAWDVHGAKRAGLTGGFVARRQPFPAVMGAPDVAGESMLDVARAIVALP